MTQSRKTVAVFFGGRSPEHDVSIVTGLQVLHALDGARYDAFPVYIAPDGRWLTGDALRERANYLPDENTTSGLREVTLDLTPSGKGVLLPRKRGLFGGGKPQTFDVALPAFHGLFGEDGPMQGVFEAANVPYAGPRLMASALFMDKAATKQLMLSLGIPSLPYVLLRRPKQGLMMDRQALKSALEATNIGFPCILKPCNLGSSIGVGKANDLEEALSILPGIFKYDTVAIAEPFVPNLVEYNVAVSQASGTLTTSAIERPKATSELLDFKQKYMSGGGGKGGGAKTGTKSPGTISQGMLSLTRELNPALPAETDANIRRWAMSLFAAVGGSGAPRIDYLCNGKTGEVWMNEVNPCPGSFGYFLWEASPDPVLFTPFLTYLVEEAFDRHQRVQLPVDPVPVDARLFKRL